MSLSKVECPVARALDVIGDWWSLLIIRDAFDCARRFGEFQESLGVSKGVLSARLRDLTERGIFQSAPASDGTAYREYVLTEKGRGLFLVIVALRQWGEAHLYQTHEPRSALVDVAADAPVMALGLRSAEGRLLTWSDTRVRRSAQNETAVRNGMSGSREDEARLPCTYPAFEEGIGAERIRRPSGNPRRCRHARSVLP